MTRWDSADLGRLLIALAFLLAARALLPWPIAWWEALRYAGGLGMLLLGMVLLAEVLSRWFGLRAGGSRTNGPPKIG